MSKASKPSSLPFYLTKGDLTVSKHGNQKVSLKDIQEYVRLKIKGYPIKDIAFIKNVSVVTVRNYLNGCFFTRQKLVKNNRKVASETAQEIIQKLSGKERRIVAKFIKALG